MTRLKIREYVLERSRKALQHAKNIRFVADCVGFATVGTAIFAFNSLRDIGMLMMGMVIGICTFAAYVAHRSVGRFEREIAQLSYPEKREQDEHSDD